MSRDLRGMFAGFNATGRKFQVSQKAAPKELPALLGEYRIHEQNLEFINLTEKFLEKQLVSGQEARDLGRVLLWLENVRNGETQRLEQIRARLPDENAEIKLGEAKEEAPAVAVGGVELQKGEPVL